MPAVNWPQGLPGQKVLERPGHQHLAQRADRQAGAVFWLSASLLSFVS